MLLGRSESNTKPRSPVRAHHFPLRSRAASEIMRAIIWRTWGDFSIGAKRKMDFRTVYIVTGQRHFKHALCVDDGG